MMLARPRRFSLLLLGLLALSACDSPTTGDDAGDSVDAGPLPDGFVPGQDAGPLPDGAIPDEDAGPPVDAGPLPDGFVPDLDAGPLPDGALPDAGPPPTTCTTPDARRCGANGAVEVCAAGMWALETQCSFGCSAGACTSEVTCTPGQSRCTGNVSEICNATGSAFLYLATCPVSCSAGLCAGACTPGERRCNADSVEECMGDGSGWMSVESCTLTCDAPTRTCVHDGLEIASNTTLEGDVVVDGAFILRSGTTLRSETGELNVRADSIVIELGATIIVDAVGGGGTANSGASSSSCSGVTGGSGGAVPPASGQANDARVGPGANGGRGGSRTNISSATGGAGGLGGGVLRLVAESSITVAGDVRADGLAGGNPGSGGGGGGGGAGGGILVVAPTLDVTGTLSAQAGLGATGSSCSGARDGRPGAEGFVKTFSDAEGAISGTVNARHVAGMRPPLTMTSSTHPNPALVYHDGASGLAFTWSRPFAVQGYFVTLNSSRSSVPTSATGTFVGGELFELDPAMLSQGPNYFHIVPINASSLPGTIQNYFEIQLDTVPPAALSSSHPNRATWYPSTNPFFSWTPTQPDANYRGFYYVLDQFGDTVPDETATWLDVSQQQILLANVPAGVHMFHVLAVDRQGYRTQAASHVRVQIGPDPGAGTVFGRVRSGSTDLQNARVTINRGLLRSTNPDGVTLANGAYNMMGIPVGTWEATASATGYAASTQSVVVTADGMTAADFNLTAL